jgi:very-short-patch-repair endonuclease
MEQQATLNARTNARALRVGMTDGERRLWSRLRSEQLGVKFRRQHPIGSYVLDFACLNPKLAIEVDGSQHLEQVAYDERRARFLNSQGFRVLRFNANEVLVQTDAVVMQILHELGALTPPPQPSPSGGGSHTNSLGSTLQRTDK